MKRIILSLNDKYQFLLPVISLSSLLIIWMLASKVYGDIVPSPVQTMVRFIEMFDQPVANVSVWGHIGISLYRVLIAFAIASVIGIGLGLAMGWSKDIDDFVGPVFELLRPIPPIAWIPLVILWFGIGETPKIFIVFVGSFVPVVLNTYTGVKMIDPLIVNAVKTLNATNVQLLREVVIPGSLPAVFAGLRNALGSGWMCVLAAEMVAAKSGVGFLIIRGMESGDAPLIICSMIIIGVVGATIAIVLSRFERWLCPWRLM